MPTTADKSDNAFCWPMLCPFADRFCGAADALPCTWPETCESDCSAVLAALMIVLTLVMVSPNAVILASCERAAMAKPSFTPMPE